MATKPLHVLALAVGVMLLPSLSNAADRQARQFQRVIEEAHAKYKGLTEGKNADYIPILTTVPSDLFAVVIVDGSYGNKTTTAVKAEQAAAGYPQSGSLDVKLWVVLDQTPPPPEPGPDPDPGPGEPVDYDRIRLIVREELDATQVTVDLQPGE